MPEIEFVEVYQPDVPEPVLARSRINLHPVIGLIPGVLRLGAAALATWAPFRWLYTITEPPDDDNFSTTTPAGASPAETKVHADGWGRTITTQRDLGGAGHGPRLGVVFEISAGLCLLAAIAITVSVLARRSRSVHIARWTGRLLAAAGAAGAAAMSATAYLSYLALHDQVLSLNAGAQDGGDGQTITVVGPSVGTGDCWLIVALAAALALVALLTSFVPVRVAQEGTDVDFPDSQRPQSLPAYSALIDPSGEQR